MLRRRMLVVAVVALLLPPVTGAGEIQSIEVTRDDGAIVAEARFTIDVPTDAVLRAFRNIDGLVQLNPAVQASESELRADGRTRVRTRVRDCVAFVCRSILIVEDMHIHDDYRITSRIVPNAGDFETGYTSWRLSATADGTSVHYVSRITPQFRLPAMIGSRAVRGSLRRQILATSLGLEVLHRQTLR